MKAYELPRGATCIIRECRLDGAYVSGIVAGNRVYIAAYTEVRQLV